MSVIKREINAFRGRSSRLAALFIGDRAADRAVPPTGHTAWTTLISAAAMAFIAVFVLALSLAAGRLASTWSDELARSATIRINAPAETIDAQTETVLRLLSETPGIADAQVMDEARQKDLLAPWFGEDLPLDALPIPRMIEIEEERVGPDVSGLKLRLEAEAPDAVFDDHSRWRAPLVSAANGLRRLGWLSLLLIWGTVGAIISLAATASLAANAQVIDVLRLIGATDDYIAKAFIRRYTMRALSGAAVGSLIAVVLILLIPSPVPDGGVLTGLGFQSWHWLLVILVPILIAAIAFAATRFAAKRSLLRRR
ncbi:cell division protein FtsX [Paracoccaceae bacterium GXU_MW_L88]